MEANSTPHTSELCLCKHIAVMPEKAPRIQKQKCACAWGFRWWFYHNCRWIQRQAKELQGRAFTASHTSVPQTHIYTIYVYICCYLHISVSSHLSLSKLSSLYLLAWLFALLTKNVNFIKSRPLCFLFTVISWVPWTVIGMHTANMKERAMLSATSSYKYQDHFLEHSKLRSTLSCSYKSMVVLKFFVRRATVLFKPWLSCIIYNWRCQHILCHWW